MPRSAGARAVLGTTNSTSTSAEHALRPTRLELSQLARFEPKPCWKANQRLQHCTRRPRPSFAVSRCSHVCLLMTLFLDIPLPYNKYGLDKDHVLVDEQLSAPASHARIWQVRVISRRSERHGLLEKAGERRRKITPTNGGTMRAEIQLQLNPRDFVRFCRILICVFQRIPWFLSVSRVFQQVLCV